MTLISDKLSFKVEHIREELTSALTQMAAYVDLMEKTPGQIETNCTTTITSLSTNCQDLSYELGKYSLFFANVANVVTDTDDRIEFLADRYLERSKKIGIPISTAQAMEHFNRSRSTIYRWIKSGKLKAEKQGHRWVIFL